MNFTNQMDIIAAAERMAAQDNRVAFFATALVGLVAGIWLVRWLVSRDSEERAETRKQNAENLAESRAMNRELMAVISNNTAATQSAREALDRNSAVLTMNSDALRDARAAISNPGTHFLHKPQ